MSGTHYGTCVLHVAPEAAVGGPLALIRTGDGSRVEEQLVTDGAVLAAYREHFGINLERVPERAST